MADKYTHRRLPVGWPDETTVCAVVLRFPTPGGVRVGYCQMLCMRHDQAASFRTPSTKGTPSMTSAIS